MKALVLEFPFGPYKTILIEQQEICGSIEPTLVISTIMVK